MLTWGHRLSSIAISELYLNHTSNILNYIVCWLLPFPKAMSYMYLSFCVVILKTLGFHWEGRESLPLSEFAWLGFGSGRAAEVASEKSCQKFSLCLTELDS